LLLQDNASASLLVNFCRVSYMHSGNEEMFQKMRKPRRDDDNVIFDEPWITLHDDKGQTCSLGFSNVACGTHTEIAESHQPFV
jgi:hypothetical protein